MEGKPSFSEASSRKLFLPSLVMTSLVTNQSPTSVLVTLLLLDIGNTFNTSVGVTGQINTAYSIAAFILALFTGVLSVRFGHKSLLLVGVLLMTVSALGCFSAPDFTSLFAFYSLSGAGLAIANPMTFTLIGEHLPLEKRPKAIGWINAGGSTSLRHRGTGNCPNVRIRRLAFSTLRFCPANSSHKPPGGFSRHSMGFREPRDLVGYRSSSEFQEDLREQICWCLFDR